MSRLILASSSPHRRRLLERLGLEFETRPSDVDEQARPGEDGPALAARLANEKAERIARDAVDSIVIGADQVAELNGQLLGKPGDYATALKQLLACQGETALFHTAVTVVATARDQRWETLDRTRLRFWQLKETQLRRYLELEQPYDCAGGFKVEGLGITLFDAVESNDPTALVGLPLIWLTRVLRELGLDPLNASHQTGR